MPMYVYTCKACGLFTDEFSSVSERDKPRSCTCGGGKHRDLCRTLSGSPVNGMMVDHPRWSDALGCNPTQIPEFTRTWPWMEFNREGQCLVKNRAEKLRILKARGFVERN